MSSSYLIKDTLRRDYRYTDNYQIDQVLPDFFKVDYPTLLKLFEHYYEFLDSDQSPSKLLNETILARDISAVDTTLLPFIEDELLLGQSYFQGFQNKRAALKYSNTLYRSKGTLFSIQQFFRTFFGITPEIRYTKEDRFMVGEIDSKIGPDSEKFLTNAELYQVFAILIKVGIPVEVWREAYKLFVHPAGMFFAGQVVVEGTADNILGDLMPDFVKISVNPVIETQATLATPFAVTDLTGIIDSDGLGTNALRIDLPTQINTYLNLPLSEIDPSFDTVSEFIGTNSPTFDEDSAGTDGRVARFSQNNALFDTFDEVKYHWYDSDSA